MSNIIYKSESFKIIGLCMEVHKNLGKGLLEIVYKEALEYEFNINNIPYEREKAYIVNYKNIILPHKFYADFVVFEKIILEVKCVTAIANEHLAQTLNYLKISGCKFSLLIYFGQLSLQYKSIVL